MDTEGVIMSNKPLVFNYQHYDTLRDKCDDMALEIEELKKKNEEQMFDIMRLKEENTNLKIKVRILEEDRRNDKGIRR